MIWSTFLFDSLIILFGEMIHSVPSYVKNFCGLCGSKHIGDGVIKQLDVHVSTSKKVSDSEKRKSSRLLPGGPLLLVSLIIAQNYRHFQVPIAGKFWPFSVPKPALKRPLYYSSSFVKAYIAASSSIARSFILRTVRKATPTFGATSSQGRPSK